METKFWIERWEEGQIGFHQSEVNAHLQNFWPKLDIPEGSQILVPLCGKTHDLLWLLKEGYKVLLCGFGVGYSWGVVIIEV